MRRCLRALAVITSYERNASCAGTQFRSRASEFEGNSANRYHAECPNHSAMIRPSKRTGIRR